MHTFFKHQAKICIVLIAMAMHSLCALAGNQDITINLDKVPLKTVFEKISQQSSYTF